MITPLPATWMPSYLEVVEDRFKVLGGTDIAALVMGADHPWSTPYDIWLNKTGKHKAELNHFRLKRGQAMEPFILNEYARTMNRQIIQPRCVIKDSRSPWMGASLDAIWEDAPSVIDAKDVSSFSYRDGQWGLEGTDEVPDYYAIQILWYALILNAPYGELPACVNDKLKVYIIPRNPDLENHMQEVARHFWFTHIIPDVPPKLSYSENAAQYLKKMFPAHKTPLRAATPMEDKLVRKYAYVRAKRETYESEEENLKFQISACIADSEGLNSSYGNITFKKNKDGEKTDWKSAAIMAQASPQIIKSCTVSKTGSRTFLFKPSDK